MNHVCDWLVHASEQARCIAHAYIAKLHCTTTSPLAIWPRPWICWQTENKTWYLRYREGLLELRTCHKIRLRESMMHLLNSFADLKGIQRIFVTHSKYKVLKCSLWNATANAKAKSVPSITKNGISNNTPLINLHFQCNYDSSNYNSNWTGQNNAINRTSNNTKPAGRMQQPLNSFICDQMASR